MRGRAGAPGGAFDGSTAVFLCAGGTVAPHAVPSLPARLSAEHDPRTARVLLGRAWPGAVPAGDDATLGHIAHVHGVIALREGGRADRRRAVRAGRRSRPTAHPQRPLGGRESGRPGPRRGVLRARRRPPRRPPCPGRARRPRRSLGHSRRPPRPGAPRSPQRSQCPRPYPGPARPRRGGPRPPGTARTRGPVRTGRGDRDVNRGDRDMNRGDRDVSRGDRDVSRGDRDVSRGCRHPARRRCQLCRGSAMRRAAWAVQDGGAEHGELSRCPAPATGRAPGRED